VIEYKEWWTLTAELFVCVADIAVGAFKSGHAVVLKTRPIIAYQATITSNVSSIGFNAASFNIRACITYKGKQVPSTLGKFFHYRNFLHICFVCVSQHT
jgi:hypothetical protein